MGCQDSFRVPEPNENAAFSLNGLLFRDGYVYGISPNSGKTWRAKPGDQHATVFFTLVLGGDPLINGYGLAVGAVLGPVASAA